MRSYLRPVAFVAALIGGIYAVLLIGAAAAPVASPQDAASQSNYVADRLTAEAALLARPGTHAVQPALR